MPQLPTTTGSTDDRGNRRDPGNTPFLLSFICSPVHSRVKLVQLTVSIYTYHFKDSLFEVRSIEGFILTLYLLPWPRADSISLHTTSDGACVSHRSKLIYKKDHIMHTICCNGQVYIYGRPYLLGQVGHQVIRVLFIRTLSVNRNEIILKCNGSAR